MSINEIIKKATIDFPWDLTLEQATNLLKYVAIKLPGSFHYVSSVHGSFGYFSNTDEAIDVITSSELFGTIVHKAEKTAHDFFKFKTSREKQEKLCGIQFQITPGWKLQDYRPEVLQLWEDVRKAVSDYFEENQDEIYRYLDNYEGHD